MHFRSSFGDLLPLRLTWFPLLVVRTSDGNKALLEAFGLLKPRFSLLGEERITLNLHESYQEYGYEVYWDGAADFDRLEEFIPKGVKGFVLGTALLFGHKESYAEKMKMIREKIEMFGRGMKNE